MLLVNMVRLLTQQILLQSLLSIHLTIAIPADSKPTPREVLHLLDRRQSTCPAKAPVSCASVDSKLPSDFCCQTGSSCISLDSSSSALCCPTGSSCASIHPIDCNVSLQDPSKGLLQPVFTTKLSDALPACGSNTCCPFGYTCGTGTGGAAICQIIASKAIGQSFSSTASPSISSTPGARSPTSSTQSTSSVASTSSAVSPASASSIDSTDPQSRKSSQSSNPFPPSVFLAGFFPGMLVGALGVLAWVILTGRHKKSDDNASATSSVYKKKPYISGPIASDPRHTRTDFLLKGKSLFSKRHQSEGTPGLPFDNWKMPTPPEPNNVPDQPMGRRVSAGPGAKSMPERSGYSAATRLPVTPERQIYGELAQPERETIHVYSPRNLDIPPAAVASLRGMHSRNISKGSISVSPFVTPDRPLNARPTAPSAQTSVSPYDRPYETLTPARYEGSYTQKRPRPENAVPQSRPETTFTAMLEAINFPDPMNRQAPRMPNIPNQYR